MFDRCKITTDGEMWEVWHTNVHHNFFGKEILDWVSYYKVDSLKEAILCASAWEVVIEFPECPCFCIGSSRLKKFKSLKW